MDSKEQLNNLLQKIEELEFAKLSIEIKKKAEASTIGVLRIGHCLLCEKVLLETNKRAICEQCMFKPREEPEEESDEEESDEEGSDEESEKSCNRCKKNTSDNRDYCSEGRYFQGWCKMNYHNLTLCDDCFEYLDKYRPIPFAYWHYRPN